VRQLSVRWSVPGRLAVWIAASLAVAASAGCMSVSEDEGGKPAPSSSVDRRGSVAESDGGQAAGGRQARGGKAGSDGKDTEGAQGKEGAEASPDPSGSAPAAAKPTGGGQRPHPPNPSPTRGGASPAEPPPAPNQPSEPPEPPPASPTPQPSEPTDPPSASSAPEVRAGALRRADGQDIEGEPTASPQVGPM
jgi:hypothetical protein